MINGHSEAYYRHLKLDVKYSFKGVFVFRLYRKKYENTKTEEITDLLLKINKEVNNSNLKSGLKFDFFFFGSNVYVICGTYEGLYSNVLDGLDTHLLFLSDKNLNVEIEKSYNKEFYKDTIGIVKEYLKTA